MTAPPLDCAFCPRLLQFRRDNCQKFPSFHNAPVAPFGPADAELLIVGLAPGLRGANCTGRPFTGDYAGDVLYPALIRFGFARGDYGASVADGLKLVNCRITNAVKCVPPENKPTTEEIRTCQQFLEPEIVSQKMRLRAILALGVIAHNAVLRVFGEKLSRHKFQHAAFHRLSYDISLFDSYHCSRYNINTGRLTEAMFADVMAKISDHLKRPT